MALPITSPRRCAARAVRLAPFLARLLASFLALAGAGALAADDAPLRDPNAPVKGERWREEAMPEGFHVEATELEGPVFADAAGRTLYTWPQHKLRNGYSGEAQGTIACYGEVLPVTAGLMSPYPAGIPLPEPEVRPACTDLWVPVLADGPREPIGKWSVIEGDDGRWQWAYDEQALYTSARDREAGDTVGGTRRRRTGDSPAGRVPAGPAPLVPPGFAVRTTSVGRLLTTASSRSVYAHEEESAEAVACRDACLDRWEPVPASALARDIGDWKVIERAPGERQWTFRGKPLYTHRYDTENWSQEGSDQPGWYNVFTQRAPEPPPAFRAETTIAGMVLADRDGRTVYVYRCAEDSQDQLACDHPDDTQVYRLAICGGGDPDLCAQRWPYVEADADATGTSRAWQPRWIDPATGRFAEAGAEGVLYVWTYRERPLYRYFLDEQPGDVHGAGIGEWRGKRNGLAAFWLRDDFMRGIE